MEKSPIKQAAIDGANPYVLQILGLIQDALLKIPLNQKSISMYSIPFEFCDNIQKMKVLESIREDVEHLQKGR